jgi:hypothetical protein
MRRFSRDTWLGVGLLVLLLAITFIAAVANAEERTAPPLASFSAQPNGAKALKLWLAESGYTIHEKTPSQYGPPDEAGLVFILQPILPITSDEWETLDTWLEEGGTLILAGDGPPMAAAARHYDFRLRYSFDRPPNLPAQTPLLAAPPLVEGANVLPGAFLQTGRDDFITHLATADGPVLVVFPQGEGRVVLSTTAYPFSNLGLKDAGNPALVQNVVSTAGQPGLVWFDEWHHGIQAAAGEGFGPGYWLRYTPAGRALLYAGLVIFIAVALQGWRFGRPVPLPQDMARRAPLEYITAIANLSRRAGHRRAVLDDYRHRLKRGLGHRYRLNPTLPDDQYLRHLAGLNPNLDVAALGFLLDRLRRPQVSEGELVALSADVADWLEGKQ